MNHEERRRRRLERARNRPAQADELIEVRGWAARPADGCPVAATMHELALKLDRGFAIDPEACTKCERPTVVLHADAKVWACLSCGAHGELETMPEIVGPAVTHDGLPLQ